MDCLFAAFGFCVPGFTHSAVPVTWTSICGTLPRPATFPLTVMLVSVRPEFEEGQTHVSLDLQGRESDDIDAFWDSLEKTGAFRDIQWSAVMVTEDGLNKIQMTAVYTPRTGAPR